MRSFVRTNYAVRLNKSIERKLMFGALAALRDRFPISTYNYIGMGAMWFVDFIMADRQLRIRRMISFERGRADARRAKTNAPLACIDVRSGDILRHLEKLPLERQRTIGWLDFDGEINDDIVDTVRNFAQRARTGSVVIVSVPARTPRQTRGLQDREQWLRNLFLDAVPPTLAARYFDSEDLSAFPASLVELLHETMHETVRVAPGGRLYRPLFSYVYRDGQAMATAGGMVVGRRDLQSLELSTALSMPGVGEHITCLDVPLLTAREKAVLDQLMPARAVSERRARRFGVHLPRPALASYAKWFRQYPLFAEVEVR